MKNHWINIYERKQNRWWNAEFSRNGMFLLKPRIVRLPRSTRKLMCGDDDILNTIKLIFPANSTTVKEIISFTKSAKQGMTNMYARLRMYEGVHPVCVEIENYELTDLKYVSVGGGWVSNDVHFEFTCNHIRQYVISS